MKEKGMKSKSHRWIVSKLFPVIQIASLNFSQFSGLSYVGKEYLKQKDSISWQSNFEEANENIIFEWEVF